MGEHHRLSIGIQEHFARIGELMGLDTEQRSFIERNASQTAADRLNNEMLTALPDALRERAVVVQPRAECGSAA